MTDVVYANQKRTEYIARMEVEFRENHKRYTDGSAYLKKRIAEDDTKDTSAGTNIVPSDYHPNPELDMLQDQLYSMGAYLKTLGSRIAFAKAKEGIL